MMLERNYTTISEPDAAIKVEVIGLTAAEKDGLTVDCRLPAFDSIEMKISRFWAMPSSETFTIKPIRSLVKKYLAQSLVSIDPFARNNQWTTYTNDLNPKTSAESNLFALDFLKDLRDREVKADLILFDPPYSLRQVKECYEGVGKEFNFEDSKNAGHWAKEKDICAELLTDDGIFLHCGWHSNGIGKKRGFEIIEILLVAHGRCHNDTIVTVERRVKRQAQLFTL